MRNPNHSELMGLINAIEERKIKINKYALDVEIFKTFEAFNFGLDTARDIVGYFVASLEFEEDAAPAQSE